MAHSWLVNAVKAKHMDAEVIRWADSCVSERMVEMVLKGSVIERHSVEAVVQ